MSLEWWEQGAKMVFCLESDPITLQGILFSLVRLCFILEAQVLHSTHSLAKQGT